MLDRSPIALAGMRVQRGAVLTKALQEDEAGGFEARSTSAARIGKSVRERRDETSCGWRARQGGRTQALRLAVSTRPMHPAIRRGRRSMAPSDCRGDAIVGALGSDSPAPEPVDLRDAWLLGSDRRPRPAVRHRGQGFYRAAITSLEFMSMVSVHPEVPLNSNGAGLGPRR